MNVKNAFSTAPIAQKGPQHPHASGLKGVTTQRVLPNSNLRDNSTGAVDLARLLIKKVREIRNSAILTPFLWIDAMETLFPKGVGEDITSDTTLASMEKILNAPIVLSLQGAPVVFGLQEQLQLRPALRYFLEFYQKHYKEWFFKGSFVRNVEKPDKIKEYLGADRKDVDLGFLQTSNMLQDDWALQRDKWVFLQFVCDGLLQFPASVVQFYPGLSEWIDSLLRCRPLPGGGNKSRLMISWNLHREHKGILVDVDSFNPNYKYAQGDFLDAAGKLYFSQGKVIRVTPVPRAVENFLGNHGISVLFDIEEGLIRILAAVGRKQEKTLLVVQPGLVESCKAKSTDREKRIFSEYVEFHGDPVEFISKEKLLYVFRDLFIEQSDIDSKSICMLEVLLLPALEYHLKTSEMDVESLLLNSILSYLSQDLLEAKKYLEQCAFNLLLSKNKVLLSFCSVLYEKWFLEKMPVVFMFSFGVTSSQLYEESLRKLDDDRLYQLLTVAMSHMQCGKNNVELSSPFMGREILGVWYTFLNDESDDDGDTIWLFSQILEEASRRCIAVESKCAKEGQLVIVDLLRVILDHKSDDVQKTYDYFNGVFSFNDIATKSIVEHFLLFTVLCSEAQELDKLKVSLLWKRLNKGLDKLRCYYESVSEKLYKLKTCDRSELIKMTQFFEKVLQKQNKNKNGKLKFKIIHLAQLYLFCKELDKFKKIMNQLTDEQWLCVKDILDESGQWDVEIITYYYRNEPKQLVEKILEFVQEVGDLECLVVNLNFLNNCNKMKGDKFFGFWERLSESCYEVLAESKKKPKNLSKIVSKIIARTIKQEMEGVSVLSHDVCKKYIKSLWWSGDVNLLFEFISHLLKKSPNFDFLLEKIHCLTVKQDWQTLFGVFESIRKEEIFAEVGCEREVFLDLIKKKPFHSYMVDALLSLMMYSDDFFKPDSQGIMPVFDLKCQCDFLFKVPKIGNALSEIAGKKSKSLVCQSGRNKKVYVSKLMLQMVALSPKESLGHVFQNFMIKNVDLFADAINYFCDEKLPEGMQVGFLDTLSAFNEAYPVAVVVGMVEIIQKIFCQYMQSDCVNVLEICKRLVAGWRCLFSVFSFGATLKHQPVAGVCDELFQILDKSTFEFINLYAQACVSRDLILNPAEIMVFYDCYESFVSVFKVKQDLLPLCAMQYRLYCVHDVQAQYYKLELAAKLSGLGNAEEDLKELHKYVRKLSVHVAGCLNSAFFLLSYSLSFEKEKEMFGSEIKKSLNDVTENYVNFFMSILNSKSVDGVYEKDDFVVQYNDRLCKITLSVFLSYFEGFSMFFDGEKDLVVKLFYQVSRCLEALGKKQDIAPNNLLVQLVKYFFFLRGQSALIINDEIEGLASDPARLSHTDLEELRFLCEFDLEKFQQFKSFYAGYRVKGGSEICFLSLMKDFLHKEKCYGNYMDFKHTQMLAIEKIYTPVEQTLSQIKDVPTEQEDVLALVEMIVYYYDLILGYSNISSFNPNDKLTSCARLFGSLSAWFDYSGVSLPDQRFEQAFMQLLAKVADHSFYNNAFNSYLMYFKAGNATKYFGLLLKNAVMGSG